MNMQYGLVPTTCHSYSDIVSLNTTMDKNGNPNIHITFRGLWKVTLKGTAAYEFDRARVRC